MAGKRHIAVLGLAAAAVAAGLTGDGRARLRFVVVDTGLETCYSDRSPIPCPTLGERFYGQDAQHHGPAPSYVDNGDGTVTDRATGLMWQKTPDLDNPVTFAEAAAGAGEFRLTGYDDWRLPSIKELYSLIDFNGDSRARPPVPYIDTDYFAFRFGRDVPGERLIDAQYWSSTEYAGTTMWGATTVFGVNFADGRIKGYPRDTGPRGHPKRSFVRYVRGNPSYGKNRFVDNGDGTVTDRATGLMWQQADDGKTRNWEQALAYAANLRLAGHGDWRLPNAKELQSIVDYTRAPDARDPSRRGPAIDPVFRVKETESWFWTSTTHLEGPRPGAAVYICFGQSWGFMPDRMRGGQPREPTGPPQGAAPGRSQRGPAAGAGRYARLNVHGAGAQRSDPKSGDPARFPYGLGPQGDEVRIHNYVRAVRSAQP